MRSIRFVCIVAALALWTGSPAAAQDQRTLPPAWSLTAGRGYGGGSAGHSIEDAMIAGGYGIRSCDFFCTAVPYSHGVASGWEFTARRRLSSALHVSVIFATWSGSRTVGRYLAGLFDTTQIVVRPSVTTIGVNLGVNSPNDLLFGSIGLGSFRAKLQGDGGVMAGRQTSGSHTGAILSAGVRYPSSTERGFAELRTEYRLAGEVPMDALAVPAHGSNAAGEIPASGINFNHWMIEIALGIRIK